MLHLISVEIEQDLAERLMKTVYQGSTEDTIEDLACLRTAIRIALEEDDGDAY
jgi:hypothetical protein